MTDRDTTHTNDGRRSTHLAAWAPVLTVAGVSFYSLQVGGAAGELGAWAGPPIHDLSPELTDWAQTAAAMMQLDLIISVDTSCAHLAGALGRPVWICLATPGEFRWLLEGSTTHWYDSARLFPQRTRGDWAGVFTEVASALRELVQRRGVEAA
jgi:hypothetical protein